MHLKCHSRFKDGKEHHYYNIAEKVACASRRRVERHIFYLGEVNDSQREGWLKLIEVSDVGTQQQTKAALFSYLEKRWHDLFGISYEVLLYDLTSVYFENAPPFGEADKRRFGYSRDKRSDCVQVVIALLVCEETCWSRAAERHKTGRLKTGKWAVVLFSCPQFSCLPSFFGCGFAALSSSRLCGFL